MKPQRLFTQWLAATALSLLVLVPLVRAQLNLGRLKESVDKAKAVAGNVAEKAKPAVQIAKGAVGIGPEEERLIGESVALEIVGKYGGLVRDEAIHRRMNLIGQGLAHYSSRPILNWRFAVLDSPTINAFSAPSGFVFITRGLYDLVAASDDELAAVLAHEIAHITERHALTIIARGGAVSGAAALATEHSKTAADAQAELANFDTGVADLIKTLLEKGFDPQTEFEADRIGRELAVTVGFAPGALRQTLLRLQDNKGDPKTIFSTHPPIADRLKKLPTDPAPSSMTPR